MNVSGAGGMLYGSSCQAGAVNAAQPAVRWPGEEQDDRFRGHGRVGGNGGFGKLVGSVFEALSQTLTTPAGVAGNSAAGVAAGGGVAAAGDGVTAAAGQAGDASGQNVLQQVASFMQSLFSALGQSRGHGEHHDHGHHYGHHRHHRHEGESASIASAAAVAATPAAGAAPSTPGTVAGGDGAAPAVTPAAAPATGGFATAPVAAAPVSDDSVAATPAAASPARFYSQAGHSHGLSGKLQSLLQQLGSSDANQAQGPLADLNKAFQNLVSALRPAGSSEGAAQPTLQDFLQNLVRNISGAGADSVAGTGSVINATA